MVEETRRHTRRRAVINASVSVLYCYRRRTSFVPLSRRSTHAHEQIMKDHKGDILDVDWSPDGKYLASVSVDNQIIVWDVVGGRKVGRCSQFGKNHSFFVSSGTQPTFCSHSTGGTEGTQQMCQERGLGPVRHVHRNTGASSAETA